MANSEHVELLGEVEVWNRWRDDNPEVVPDLTGAFLMHRELRGAALYGADLSGANLAFANLREANLHEALLKGADLNGADLDDAVLTRANLRDANLRAATLMSADLGQAHLAGAQLVSTNLEGAKFNLANLKGANLRLARLADAELRGARLDDADLRTSGYLLDSCRVFRTHFHPGVTPWARTASEVLFGESRSRLPRILRSTRRCLNYVFAPGPDAWSALRRIYTGPRFTLTLLLLVVFLAPRLAQAAYWVGVDAAEDRIQQVRNEAFPTSDAVARDSYRVAGLLLNFHRDGWSITLAFALLLFNLSRCLVMLYVAPMRDAEERSYVTPSKADYMKWYRIHCWVVAPLFFVSAIAFVWQVTSLLATEVRVPA